MKVTSIRPAASILALLLFILVGCVTNISGDPRFPTGYIDGAVYRTTKELKGLIYRDSLLGDLRSVRFFGPGANPKPLSGEKLVMISAGTKVRVLQVVYEKNWELGTKVDIIAVVISGPFSGASADLDGISFIEKHPDVAWGLQRRDPSVLQLEEP